MCIVASETSLSRLTVLLVFTVKYEENGLSYLFLTFYLLYLV